MKLSKTAIAGSTLLLFLIAPIQAQIATFTNSTPTTGGLRIQLDAEGNRMQPGTKGAPEAAPVVRPETGNFTPPAADPGYAGPARGSITAPAAAGPQVVHTKSGTGTVVRLNGLFRAGSRAFIGPDGKLEGDCHIDSDGGGQK